MIAALRLVFKDLHGIEQVFAGPVEYRNPQKNEKTAKNYLESILVFQIYAIFNPFLVFKRG
jgi:hypothetical protein